MRKSLIFLAFIMLVACAESFSYENEPDTLHYEYIPDVTYGYMDSALQSISSEIPLNFNENVKSFVDYFTVRDREYTRMVVERLPVYFPLMEETLKKYDLPDELKYLSIIESGLNPKAISRAGAVGLWQFMSATGRYYGLKHDFYVDDRMDPVKSTEAACKYLKSLYNMFDDWELAIAAYNCGPGNVRKAIRRSGYKKHFWEIYRYLPRETRSYLPQFVAMIYTLNNLEKHHFFSSGDVWAMSADTVLVQEFTNLSILATQIGVCPDDLRKLNPSIIHMAHPGSDYPLPVYIPVDKKEHLNLYRDSILLASAYGKEQLDYLARNTPGSTWGRTKIYYRVQSGDVLGTIAQEYKVRVSDLRAWNNINGNLIRVGQRLAIWVPDGSGLATYNTAQVVNQPVTVKDDQGNLIYTVMPGDTLWEISKRYQDLTVEKIIQLNNLKNDRITPGQKLKIG